MMLEETIRQDLPVACIPGAISAEERERWIAAGKALYAAIEEIHELDDGYAFRLPSSAWMLAAEYVSRDRLCCRFIRWTMVQVEDLGPLWLQIQGPEGTKTLMKRSIELTELVPLHVAEAAGFSAAERSALEPEEVAALVNQNDKKIT